MVEKNIENRLETLLGYYWEGKKLICNRSAPCLAIRKLILIVQEFEIYVKNHTFYGDSHSIEGVKDVAAPRSWY